MISQLQTTNCFFPLHSFSVQIGFDNFSVEVMITRLSKPNGDVDNPYAAAIVQAVTDQIASIPEITTLTRQVTEVVQTDTHVIPAP
ncbi:hypothetical protein ACFV3F_03450 [Streptomyces sp. NPDC059717]|uniref:hypothetical protein n=1 Tax=Streptomyces sp. NPDC059717 TaxID=3346922 RepID=UPI0036CC0252